jgi:hypothetical protein
MPPLLDSIDLELLDDDVCGRHLSYPCSSRFLISLFAREPRLDDSSCTPGRSGKCVVAVKEL